MKWFLFFCISIGLLSTPAIAQPGGGEGIGGGTGVSGQRLPKGCIGGIVTDSRGVASCGSGSGGSGSQVVSIESYGAVCNGVTDDTAAINAAITAVQNSTQYADGMLIYITGPAGLAGSACRVTSINATGFLGTPWVTAGLPRVIFNGITILCAGAGQICFDTSRSVGFGFRDLKLLGDETNKPAVGLQIANLNPTTEACCIYTIDELQTDGHFTFAPLYYSAAESITCNSCLIRNVETALGPVAPVGGYSVAGGSAYTDGVYTNVVLSGGSVDHDPGLCTPTPLPGCINFSATITVAGGIASVTSVSFQGKGYAVGDTLTDAAGVLGGGTGFAVTVTKVAPHSVVLDGSNHWRVSSAYQSTSSVIDHVHSFSQLNFIAGSLRNVAGPVLWITAVYGVNFYKVYLQSVPGPACVELFDNGDSGANRQLRFDGGGCETQANDYTFYMYGAQTKPNLEGFSYRDFAVNANISIFGMASNLVGATAPNINFELFEGSATNLDFQIFPNPSTWNVSGWVHVPSLRNWDFAAIFSGTLCLGQNSWNRITPQNSVCVTGIPRAYVADNFPNPVGAYSCARTISIMYVGRPLCTVRRESDSITYDIYTRSDGAADLTAVTSFCNATTCRVVTVYDQSGNGHNATQTNVTLQPSLVVGDTGLNNSVSINFGEGSNKYLDIAANSSLSSICLAPGCWISTVVNKTENIASGTHDDRIASNDALYFGFPNTTDNKTGVFANSGVGTPGRWVIPTISANGHVIDMRFNYTDIASAPPTMNVDGADQAPLTVVQSPGGTFAGETGHWILGGLDTGTRGYPGNIAEWIFWKKQPSGSQYTSVNRSQGTFYGIVVP